MRPLIVVCLACSLIGAGASRAACQGPEFAPAAVKHLKDAARNDRLEAVPAPGRIGADEEAAFPVLVKGLGDKDQDVRLGAAKALGHILAHDVKYDTKAGPRNRIEPAARAAAATGLTAALKDTN